MSKINNVSLYVSTYRKYNEGNLFGEWLDLTNYADAEEFLEACYELHSDEDDPELMFQDCENIPTVLYCESCSKSNIEELYRYIDKCNEYGQDVVDAVLDNGDSLDEVEDVYYLCEDDMLNQDENIGISYVDQLGGVENLDRETLMRYFDYEAFGRELRQEVNVFQSGHQIYYRYY
jgi:antirestriction protein